MAHTYRIYDQHGQYFITCTVHQWVDVFTRPDYVNILLDSLRYCQQKKGLEIFAWVVMTNHIHLIVSSKGETRTPCGRALWKKKRSICIAVAVTITVRAKDCWIYLKIFNYAVYKPAFICRSRQKKEMDDENTDYKLNSEKISNYAGYKPDFIWRSTCPSEHVEQPRTIWFNCISLFAFQLQHF